MNDGTTGTGGRPSALDPSDLDLVTQARAGQERAFDALVDRHSPRLYRLAVGMLGSANDAPDLVQETWIAAYRGLARFEGRAQVSTWLIGILVRQAAQYRRQHWGPRRLRLVDTPAPAEADAEHASTADVRGGDDWVARADARMDLPAVLAKLEPEQRQVLVLREMENMTYDQIAQVLQVPRGTVESRLFRARRALQDLGRGETH